MSTKLIVQFLRQPLTLIGMVTAILFQVFFSTIWITGYGHVTDRIDRLPVAILNEDGTASGKIADGISKSLNFKLAAPMSLADARDALEKRKIRMIIEIPQGFSDALAAPAGKPSIRYYVNASNPQMISNVMGTAAGKITAGLNEQINEAALAPMLEGLKLPQGQADFITSSAAGRVAADIQTLHPVDNFARYMVPLMFVTASYTGSMLLAMNLNKASQHLAFSAGKWQRLAARFIITFGNAAITSLTGAVMTRLLGITSTRGFMTMWLFEFVVILACMFVAQLSLFLFGDAGAWVNIALLSIQMLSSGATIPRDLLSPFYLWIGQYLPAYYAVDGIMDLVMGGTGIARDLGFLLAIGASAAVLCVILTFFRREPKPIPATMPAGI